MKKLLYFGLTFIICSIFKLTHIWLAFAGVLLLLNLFAFENSFLWEIPFAALCIGIAESAFFSELDTLLKIFLPCSGVIIAYFLPKRLLLFFPVAIAAVFYGGIYGFCAMAAALWFSLRTIIKRPSYKTVF